MCGLKLRMPMADDCEQIILIYSKCFHVYY